jgi:cell division protein FtsX
MQKTLHLIRYAFQSLLERPFKFFSLVFVYAWVVAFYGSIIFFTSALQKQTKDVLSELPEIWLQKLQGGRLVAIEKHWQDSLAQIRGVKKVQARYWGYVFDEATGAVFTLMGKDSLPSETAQVGAEILALKGLENQDFISLTTAEGSKMTWKIGSVFSPQTAILTQDLVVVPTLEAQLFLGLAPQQATDLAVSIYNPAEIDNISRKIKTQFPAFRLTRREELEATYQALFSWRGGILLYGSLLGIFAFLILAWERAAGLNAAERREIGILKAVGWHISDVLRLKFYEGGLVAILATSIGILFAFLHVFIFKAPLLKPLLAGWSVLYPSFHLYPLVSVGDILAIFALSLFPYLTATLIPAWKAAVTEAAEVMR